MHFAVNNMNNSYLYVDIDILRRNIRTILASLPKGTKLIPVLKDDAYGLGLKRIAQVIEEFDCIDCIGVAHVSEGLALRSFGCKMDILVMGSALPFQLPSALNAGLILAAGAVEFVTTLEAAAGALGMEARVHIKIDTGLHRLGVEPGEELAALIAALDAAEHVRAEGVFSHFADTVNTEFSVYQYGEFEKAMAQLDAAGYTGLLRHISSSASHELFPEYALDAVRIGRGLYMDSPDHVSHGIDEMVTWRTFITAIKDRHAGDGLGYAGAFQLEKDARVATIGVGYGDGLDMNLCRVHAPVLIAGKDCPLLACCMDQAFADVTGVDCAVGDAVTIYGYDGRGNCLTSQAQSLLIGGDEGCGLTSELSSRVARVYSE